MCVCGGGGGGGSFPSATFRNHAAVVPLVIPGTLYPDLVGLLIEVLKVQYAAYVC